MSQQERDELDWLRRAKEGSISQREAAQKMGVSDRWVRKLVPGTERVSGLAAAAARLARVEPARDSLRSLRRARRTRAVAGASSTWRHARAACGRGRGRGGFRIPERRLAFRTRPESTTRRARAGVRAVRRGGRVVRSGRARRRAGWRYALSDWPGRRMAGLEKY